MNNKFGHDDLVFIPVGGANEIGMNLNAYHYKGKWLLVDCGAGFADDSMPGVDMIVPDPSFFHDKTKDIVALIITHAHEDHVGAVPHLWEVLKCPIYTTPFTAAFLKQKLFEYNIFEPVSINEIDINTDQPIRLDLKPFDIEIVPLTHSTAEMHALFIRTEYGNIFHTGDWKFDDDPVVGQKTDFKRLENYGKEGVLAMVGDSTNIFNPGKSGSEGELNESLLNLVNQGKNMVVITTFASNVARLQTILDVAAKANRKVVLAGRSLWRILNVARDTGYLSDTVEIYKDNMLSKFKRKEVLLVCTGCQGEPMAATAKLASNTHPFLRVHKGDMIIFSSKIIPGNDKKIYGLFNKFTRMGVEVCTEREHFVHVSGHPSQEEVKLMYELLRPQIAVPVHGEAMHIHYHAKFARDYGVKKAFEVENGSVVKLAPGEPELLDLIKTQYLGIDGYSLKPQNSPVFSMRRKLSYNGILFVSLVLGQNHRLLASPAITAPGVYDVHEDKDLHDLLLNDVVMIVNETPYDNNSIDKLEKNIKNGIKNLLKETIGKIPMIYVKVNMV